MGLRYNFAVGKKAETMAFDMMRELGFDVVKFGVEHILPEYCKKGKSLQGQAGKFVRGQPDFLIVDPETREAFFIEVKYRSGNRIRKDSLIDYPNNFILLFSLKGILIADWAELKGQEDNMNCFKLLTQIKPFRNKDKSILIKYVEKVKQEFY